MDPDPAECADVLNPVHCISCHVPAGEGEEADAVLSGPGHSACCSPCSLPDYISESVTADCE